MRPRVPPVVVLAGAGLLMWLIRRVDPAPVLDLPGARWLAPGLAAAGVLVAALGVGSFRRAGTTVNPMAPERASTLVVSGIYRHTRNPMYLGMALLLAAWGVWLSSLPALVGVPVFVVLMSRFQITPEERALEARFGEEFRSYRRRVRRWL